jgi:hypothetical protein
VQPNIKTKLAGLWTMIARPTGNFRIAKTARLRSLGSKPVWNLVAAGALCSCLPAHGAVLPEDRADVLYHSYDGGGVKITGPSVLVRKQFGKSTSVYGNYYVDSISGASIDVVTTASPYKEERTEKSVGVDYLHDKTTMSLSYTHSKENDFLAKTGFFSISQSMFGDLTTVTLGYSRGSDVVGNVKNPDFEKDVSRQNYSVGVSQVLTKNTLLDFGWETITDEGFLNNPYRSVRYLDPSSPIGYSYQAEQYPQTHTSNAAAIRALCYLPYRAAIHGEYSYFRDTWGVKANTAEVGYTHPLKSGWTLDVLYRMYQQTRADFYSDLFPRADAQNYLARDKELSTFGSKTIGLSVSYEFLRGGWHALDKGSLNLAYNHIRFNYDDFRDVRVKDVPPGEEPLYSFSANVLQLYLSLWY